MIKQFFTKSDIDRWKYSYQVLYFLAIVNIAIGIVSFVIKSNLLASLGDKYLLGSGILFILCAVFVHVKKSSLAIWISTIYWSIEILFTFASIFYAKSDIIIGGLFMKLFILYYLVGGISPVKRLSEGKPVVVKQQGMESDI